MREFHLLVLAQESERGSEEGEMVRKKRKEERTDLFMRKNSTR